MNKIIQGHCIEELKNLPDKRVNMCMTSPPYWVLRDYGSHVETIWDERGKEIGAMEKGKCWNNGEHDWGKPIIKSTNLQAGNEEFKRPWREEATNTSTSNFCSKCRAWKGQLGLEPTFELYIKHLCDIFDEVKRVLRDDGTCWINIGDTYYGGGKGETSGINKAGGIEKVWKRPSREANDKARIGKECLECGKEIKTGVNGQFCSRTCLNKQGNDFRSQNRLLPDKTLCMIPFRFVIEMVNRGWILRNTIIWHKRNCMPSSAKDRFTVDFEYLFFFSKNKRYYFETQYEPMTESTKERYKYGWGGNTDRGYVTGTQNHLNKHIGSKHSQYLAENVGRNKRTVWVINPTPFSEAHFAVYPEELCETPIKAGCPEFVCKKCGNPKEAIFEPSEEYAKNLRNQGKGWSSERRKQAMKIGNALTEAKKHISSEYIHKGYKPTCSCNFGFTSGIVLDPFFGAGTTGLVALKQNKKFIGIELNKEYIKIAEKRLKPFLEQTKL